jgi:hypothetical protein
MQTLRDIYVQEALDRMGHGRHRRTRAPGDEGPRRSLARAAARVAGRALIGLGARLLSFGGERARAHIRGARVGAELAHYTAPPTYSRN